MQKRQPTTTSGIASDAHTKSCSQSNDYIRIYKAKIILAYLQLNGKDELNISDHSIIDFSCGWCRLCITPHDGEALLNDLREYYVRLVNMHRMKQSAIRIYQNYAPLPLTSGVIFFDMYGNKSGLQLILEK